MSVPQLTPLLLLLALVGPALAGPVQQCLQSKCGTYYSACSLLSDCRHELIDCMTNCSSGPCEVECFTTASNTMPKLELPALIALDVCGGSDGCFPSRKAHASNQSVHYRGAPEAGALLTMNVTLINDSPLPLQVYSVDPLTHKTHNTLCALSSNESQCTVSEDFIVVHQTGLERVRIN